METPILKPIGTPVDQLDTPSLILDLSVLERNIEYMHSFFRDKNVTLRPNVSTHLCPAIAHKQVAAGETSGGICVTTVGQAEIFAESGFTDVFLTTVTVTPIKIVRLCALALSAKITIVADNIHAIRGISEIASSKNVKLDVVVEINSGLDICGVEPGYPALELAKVIHESPSLNFAGLMTDHGLSNHMDTSGLIDEIHRRIGAVIETKNIIENDGLFVDKVSVGGTVGFDVVSEIEDVTEVRAGSYALLDGTYSTFEPQFAVAARVMTTVTSLPEAGIIITDGGGKSIGSEWGNPSVDNLTDVAVQGLSAEHVNLRRSLDVVDVPSIGSKVWFTPSDMRTCSNLHDYFFGVRDGILETVWNISARGRYR